MKSWTNGNIDIEYHYFMESIIENSYDGIYITDKTGLTLMVNKAYERITGKSKEHFIGKYMKDLMESGEMLAHVTKDVVEQKRSITVREPLSNGKNVITTGNPIFDKNGEVSKVFTNVRDISELINLEKQFNASQEILKLYKQEIYKDVSLENIVCNSQKTKQVMMLAKKVAQKESTVLLLGETGVGKEVIAKYIHANSNRRDRPYIKINCGSIPNNLLESELFGYVEGAFTDAKSDGKTGMFELAHEGTLFLDEIGELPQSLQSSLLRAIQEGEVIRLGDSKSITVDVRIIAATNRNLKLMVEEGTFRSDLFYRLNVFSIEIPSLRNRTEDIPALAEAFIENLNRKYRAKKIISLKFIEQLLQQSWPGNIRELSNFVERQFILEDGEILDSFITNIQWKDVSKKGEIRIMGLPALEDAIRDVEAILLERAFKEGKTTYKAAEILGISQPTFSRKYNKYFGF